MASACAPPLHPDRFCFRASLTPHIHSSCFTRTQQIARDLLTWPSLSAVTSLNLGAFEARTDAAIICHVLPRAAVTAASVFGTRGCRPPYDVFGALAAATSLTSLQLQVG